MGFHLTSCCEKRRVSGGPPNSGFSSKKIQITKHKYQMVRQAHHLTTLSQVEGQITMIEIQNPKQQAFEII
jgi:hypothetical protein